MCLRTCFVSVRGCVCVYTWEGEVRRTGSSLSAFIVQCDPLLCHQHAVCLCRGLKGFSARGSLNGT